jgi:mono/diheme cytochrome c family protein
MNQGIRIAALMLLVISFAGTTFAQTSAADIYRTKCAMCHGPDGLAATPTAKNFKVLSFKDPAMISASDAQFFTSTKDGKNKMPAYKDKLTDDQIKDVIAYIRTLQK